MTTVVFKTNTEDVLKTFTALSAALSGAGLAAFLSGTVHPYLQKRAIHRFAIEGDDVSGKWLPLRPATVTIREANPDWPVGGEHPINVRTHELENWITQSDSQVMPHSLGATLRFPKPTSRKSITDKMESAQVGKGRTPARPVLGVNATDLLAILVELEWYLETAVEMAV